MNQPPVIDDTLSTNSTVNPGDGIDPTLGVPGADAQVAPTDAVVQETPVAPDVTDPTATTQEVQLPDAANYQTPTAVVQPAHEDGRVNSVEAILAERGITNEQALTVFGKALEAGDFNQIDRSGLETLVGKATADMIMSNLSSYNADCERQSAEALTFAHNKFGGQDKFDAAVTWLNNNLNHPSLGPELAEVKVLAAAGGAKTRLALDILQNRFNASGVAPTAGLINPDQGGGNAPVAQPFKSNREYAEAVQKAYDTGDRAAMAEANRRFQSSTHLHRD